MSLAAERTYLAYVRTALALLAAGVAVVGALPDAGHLGLRRAIGLLLLGAGLAVAGTARRRWQAIDVAMRRGDPLPGNRLAGPIGIAVMLAGLLAVALVLVV